MPLRCRKAARESRGGPRGPGLRGALGLVGLVGAVAVGCGAPPARPDVLLVSIDTLRADALRAYAPTAPAHPELDALAALGLVFEDVLSTAPWTLPAHASLFTGLQPGHHGAVGRGSGIRRGLPTLAEALRDAGYETVAFTGAGFVGRRFGFARGFERYDAWVDAPRPDEPPLPRGGAAPKTPGEHPFARAVAYLRARRSDRPLFLFVHTFAVHDYFHARPEAVARAGVPAFEDPRHAGRCLRGREACPPADWARLRAWYRAEVALVDEALGRLLAALEASGRRERTLVVLLSDHGEGFDPARHRIHHGGRLHADQLRVPLIVAGPGIASGRTRAPVSLVDLMPSLLVHLELPVPDGLDGVAVALAPGEGAPARGHPRFAAEHHYLWRNGPRRRVTAPPAHPIRQAVITRDLWLVDGFGGPELYDVAADPAQRHDLAPQGVPAPLRRLADAARSDDAVAGMPVEQDPELRAQLEALGYVE